MTLQTNVLFGK